MLRTIASVAKTVFDGHKVYRMGGDEFLILAKNMDEITANANTKKLIKEVNKNGYSVSCGVAWTDSDHGLASIVKQANLKMRQCKEQYYASRGYDRDGNVIN